MRTTLLLTTVLAFPTLAFAAGGGSDSSPTPTQTTTTCQNGLVYDASTKSCVAPKESSLDDDALYDAARELAYFGQPEEALGALAAMSEGDTDRVLTYKGFANRKAGNLDAASTFYLAALRQNPDNHLARSYMGQGLVEQGDLVGALAQLREIEARGGKGTWAEVSLAEAIRTGTTYNY